MTDPSSHAERPLLARPLFFIAATLIAAAMVAAGGCSAGSADFAGKSCTTARDCPEDFTCMELERGVRTCQTLTAPPEDVLAGNAYYCTEAKPILRKYCVSTCHGEITTGSLKSDFRLDYYVRSGAVPGAFAKAKGIKSLTFDTRTMPPQAPFPTEEERALLALWVAKGASYCGDGSQPDGG